MKKDHFHDEVLRQFTSENRTVELAKWQEYKPRRYYFEPRPLRGRKGLTKRRYMVPVDFGDPRYADAPYEMDVRDGPHYDVSAARRK